MIAKKIINWRALSEFMTGSPINIRKTAIPARHHEQIAELEDLLEYWMKRSGPNKKSKWEINKMLKKKR